MATPDGVEAALAALRRKQLGGREPPRAPEPAPAPSSPAAGGRARAGPRLATEAALSAGLWRPGAAPGPKLARMLAECSQLADRGPAAAAAAAAPLREITRHGLVAKVSRAGPPADRPGRRRRGADGHPAGAGVPGRVRPAARREVPQPLRAVVARAAARLRPRGRRGGGPGPGAAERAEGAPRRGARTEARGGGGHGGRGGGEVRAPGAGGAAGGLFHGQLQRAVEQAGEGVGVRGGAERAEGAAGGREPQNGGQRGALREAADPLRPARGGGRARLSHGGLLPSPAVLLLGRRQLPGRRLPGGDPGEALRRPAQAFRSLARVLRQPLELPL